MLPTRTGILAGKLASRTTRARMNSTASDGPASQTARQVDFLMLVGKLKVRLIGQKERSS